VCALDEEAHLNTCFKHFIFFTMVSGWLRHTYLTRAELVFSLVGITRAPGNAAGGWDFACFALLYSMYAALACCMGGQHPWTQRR
jgi:hypothetical protein